MNICVYGAARSSIDGAYLHAAEMLGYSIAARGHNMIFGGGGEGMMGAAASGVREALCGYPEKTREHEPDEWAKLNAELHRPGVSGRIVGITPGKMVVDDCRYPYCTDFIWSQGMNDRKQMFIDMSDAFVVLPGGLGTYDEFFDLISKKRLFESGDRDKPVAVYNLKGHFDLMEQMIEDGIARGFIAEWNREMYRFCTTEAEIWEYFNGADSSCDNATNSDGVDSSCGDVSASDVAVSYPEECCDASEISDAEYDEYIKKKESGFWTSFVEKITE